MPWIVFADLVYNSIMYVYYIYSGQEKAYKKNIHNYRYNYFHMNDFFFIISVFERGSYPNGRKTSMKIPKDVIRKSDNAITNRKDKVQTMVVK